MSRFLVTDKNSEGFKPEDILGTIRNGMLERGTKLMDKKHSETVAMIDNNIKTLIHLFENSTMVLNRAFEELGPVIRRVGKARSECCPGSGSDASGFC